ncbi:MAG TPA: tripartite tricarboxylate transporter substrate-binding protein [Burkholderiales bacterium]|nr:tripartite tricarboxylate transporter substrate-binding protein [Burkholderiales bacterium]
MHRIVVTTLAALIAAAPVALAQTFPTKPVRAIVPYPAGGTTDLVARIVTPVLAESLGQPVLVENKAGAGGTIGTAEAARAAPDGHTVLVVFDNHAVNHHLYRNLPYDPLKAFEPVSLIVQSPLLLVGATSFPPSNVGELIEYARANRGKVAFGSTGTGNSRTSRRAAACAARRL